MTFGHLIDEKGGRSQLSYFEKIFKYIFHDALMTKSRTSVNLLMNMDFFVLGVWVRAHQ